MGGAGGQGVRRRTADARRAAQDRPDAEDRVTEPTMSRLLDAARDNAVDALAAAGAAAYFLAFLASVLTALGKLPY